MPFTRDSQGRVGGSGKYLDVSQKLYSLSQSSNRLPSEYSSKGIGVVDPSNDMLWARGRQGRMANSYFDYYFSGEDVQIYMDGTESPEYGADMPITDFAFSIEQQKTPVYGYASYTYDAVMKGTRLVSGVMRCATTTTDYMTNMISRAAETRAAGAAQTVIRDMDQDEANIRRYWMQIDPGIVYNNNKQLFSTHPPFNLIIVYGMQSTSVPPSVIPALGPVYESYLSDTGLMTDVNERLVEADISGNAMRYVLEAVELQSMQCEYNTAGDICAETYKFFARDLYTPVVNSSQLV